MPVDVTLTVSDADALGLADPRQPNSFDFHVPTLPHKEKVLLRVCNLDRCRKEQTDNISLRLNVFVNGAMVFAGVSCCCARACQA